jgi:imidazolonepropionase-like amidohydrolase
MRPMGLMDFIKGEYIEIVQWTDDTRNTLTHRFPDADKAIKNGAQLIVRESQYAQFVYLGQFGDAFGRAESVDVHDALRAVTIWAARQMFLEQKIGSVEVGKYADLAVWDRDFYTVPTDQIKDARCELTIFNGKVVYRAP